MSCSKQDKQTSTQRTCTTIVPPHTNYPQPTVVVVVVDISIDNLMILLSWTTGSMQHVPLLILIRQPFDNVAEYKTFAQRSSFTK